MEKRSLWHVMRLCSHSLQLIVIDCTFVTLRVARDFNTVWVLESQFTNVYYSNIYSIDFHTDKVGQRTVDIIL